MLLSDRDLRDRINRGELIIVPDASAQIQPSSVDVRLSRFFRIFANHEASHIDPLTDQEALTVLVTPEENQPFMLHPGEFALASTLEHITLPADLAARLEGKSSLGRLGLLVHSTAGFIDPGFSGHITLELSCAATLPIALWPGMDIGQLCVLQLSSPAEVLYGDPRLGSKYQNQTGPTASRFHLSHTEGDPDGHQQGNTARRPL